ncbi:MAG: glycosyltransferase [Candidatus Woesearchaeota archaeon]
MAKADYVFEASWEVCNKFGGIHTVIKSKSSQMMETYKNYFLIGPYFEKNAKVEFISMDPPEEFRDAFAELGSQGIICHFGKWLELKGLPYTILIDFSGILEKTNVVKGEYWKDYGIDSIRAGWDFDEPSMWSYAVGMMIHKLYEKSLRGKNVIAHFHEWLAGFGLLYLRKNCHNVATVFTTHATVLGRSLSSSGVDIYAMMQNILSRQSDIIKEAYARNIEAKHLTESATANNAHIFTTVSEITAIESECFLGRKPEVILLNGLDLEKFPSFEDISIKHISSRDKIREFLTYYFFPYYTYDVNNSLIFYTQGRFEYTNKGYDLIIRALGLVNERLKRENSTKTASVMFWVPLQTYGIRLDVLENKNYYMHIKNYVYSNSPDILQKITYDFISKKDNVEELFTDQFLRDIKKDLMIFSRTGTPPLSTHNIDENNVMIRYLRENNLLNRSDDRIKVIVEPVYLDGNDGLIDLGIYDAMAGCHLGMFPSYYEPYGYTPLESAALGVPTITTDMAGFGRYIKTQNPDNKGIIVLERTGKPDHEVTSKFADVLYGFIMMDKSDRINEKLRAKALSNYADWKLLIKNYIAAHDAAITKLR